MSIELSLAAGSNRQKRSLAVLDDGNCETLKAVVHSAALGLAMLMAAYNAAAWLRRRQSHLGVNAIFYGVAVLWEVKRVTDHLVPCLPDALAEAEGPDEPLGDQRAA